MCKAGIHRVNPWKACDIRGVFPREVSPQLMRLVGSSVGSMVPLDTNILIAGDFRSSTPPLKAALLEGLMESGAHVLDAGQIPTPIAYFAKKDLDAEGVLIVTASHNPAHHNGLKLMIGGLPPAPEDFDRLRRAVSEGKFREAKGTLKRIDPVPRYRDWILTRWEHLRQGASLNLVLDAGNGTWSEIAPEVFEALGFRIHRLFCHAEGTFPNRSPNCALPGALSALRKKVRETNASFGVAWDGDGDRVAFVDENASPVSSDEVSALLVRYLLRNRPGARVVFDIKLADLVRRTVVQCQGIPLMERSGHTFIKRKMIEEDCLLGCEVSGHYFYRELNGGDDGLFSALLLAEMVKRAATLSRLRKSLAPYFATPDLRLPAGVLPYGEITTRLRRVFPR